MAIEEAENRIQQKFTSVVKFSDCAPMTYTSKFACYIATLDRRVERNYFGSNQVKSLADGEGAATKCALDEAVKSQDIFIDDAEGAYNFLKTTASEDVHSHYIKKPIIVESVQR